MGSRENLISVCLWEGLFFSSCVSLWLFVFRTQEELRVREEDQQTITVEVELKRHDSEPTISVPQPTAEIRLLQQQNDSRVEKHLMSS